MNQHQVLPLSFSYPAMKLLNFSDYTFPFFPKFHSKRIFLQVLQVPLQQGVRCPDDQVEQWTPQRSTSRDLDRLCGATWRPSWTSPFPAAARWCNCRRSCARSATWWETLSSSCWTSRRDKSFKLFGTRRWTCWGSRCRKERRVRRWWRRRWRASSQRWSGFSTIFSTDLASPPWPTSWRTILPLRTGLNSSILFRMIQEPISTSEKPYCSVMNEPIYQSNYIEIEKRS